MHDHDHSQTDHAPTDKDGHAHTAPDSDEHCWYKGGPFRDELTSHLPFSVLSVTVGLVLAGLICFLTTDGMLASAQQALHSHDHAADAAPADAGDDNGSSHEGHDHTDHDHAGHDHGTNTIAAASDPHNHGSGPAGGFFMLFHLFHPAHMLFSAAATAAMFWRYERSLLKAVLIGFSGAVVVCGVSDIAMPRLSVWIMDEAVPQHICIIDHPMLVIPFAVLGVLLGIAAASGGTVHSTIFSHSMHVSASTMASIFYIIGSMGRLEWINEIGLVFMFVSLAVVLPCCLSDIVYPLMFARPAREEFSRSGHQHCH